MDQRTKNIRLLSSLGIILVLIAATTFLNSGDQVNVDRDLFAIQNLESVDKVALESQGGTINLNLSGSRWRVNERLADRNMIDVFFATLQQAEVKRPLPVNQQDSISKLMDEKGVTVKLFSGETMIGEFQAFGNASKSQAYFKHTNESIPYVMNIPGYRVYVSGIFELPETGWLDKYVFNFNWRNFQDLFVNYPKHPADDFNVKMGEGFFTIPSISAVDTTRLNNFLDAVSLLTIDAYIPKTDTTYDSLLGMAPEMTILIHDVANTKYSLEIFEKLPGQPGRVIRIGGSQVALLQEEKVRELLRTKSFFVTSK